MPRRTHKQGRRQRRQRRRATRKHRRTQRGGANGSTAPPPGALVDQKMGAGEDWLKLDDPDAMTYALPSRARP